MFSLDFQNFVKEHAQADVLKLALQAHLYPKIAIKLAIQQIQGRQKAKTKLPFLYACDNIVYPIPLSVEQCSSEMAANFKANLLKKLLQLDTKREENITNNTTISNTNRTTLIDLTGGFGIDSYFFSKVFEKVIHIEQQQELSEIAAHNFRALQATNISCYCENGLEFLQTYSESITCLYIDPARRDKNSQKVVSLEDCEPNLVEILPFLWQKTTAILLKTSPMLDLKKAILQLTTLQPNCVRDVVIVAVENECKEVLYYLTNPSISNQNIANQNITEINKQINFHTFNLHTNKAHQEFSFSETDEQNVTISYQKPLQYLYEPNAAVLKSGAFKTVAHHFGLYKLHSNTHLYTSDNLVSDFVGRTFAILQVCKFDKKEILQHLANLQTNQKLNQQNSHLQANISVRNFPLSVEEFRKKTGIKDGGEIYIFAATDMANHKIVIISKAIKP